MTLVSIITPSYNQADYLEQTMRSVLDQDYPKIQYIVVDGGSTDGSVEIIRKYADRLAWWISEKDSGQADAINKGMARAEGEIIAWLNSDDYYLPGTIRAVVDALDQHPNALLVYGDMLAVDERGRTINKLVYRQLTLEDFLCYEIIGQPSVFIRRYAMEKAGKLDPSMHFLLDHQLWIRVARLGQMLHVQQFWSAARYHPAAKNLSQPLGFGREAFKILNWASEDPVIAPVLKRVYRRARASAYRVNARYSLDAGDAWSSLVNWVQALWLHPSTALARINLFGSAIFELIGLAWIRRRVLTSRSQRLSG